MLEKEDNIHFHLPSSGDMDLVGIFTVSYILSCVFAVSCSMSNIKFIA